MIMAEDGPSREFGRRKPVAPATGPAPKRSGHVALLLMGSFAVGGGAYALMPKGCEPPSPAMVRKAEGASRAKAAFDRKMTPSESTEAIAIGVELKKRAKRTSAARRSSAFSSPGARLITSVREGPGEPSLE